MEGNSSLQQSGRKHNCRALQANHSDDLSALKHLLTSYHQHATMMTKHQPQHSIGDHTLVIMLLPLSPFKKQTFQVWLSLIYSTAYAQIAYIYKLITATWTLGYKAAVNDWIFYLRGAIGTHIWVLNTKNAWCSFDFLCIDATLPGRSCCESNGELGNLITWFSCDFLPERSSVIRKLYTCMNDKFMALLYSFFWSSKPEDWKKEGKSRCRAY